MSVRNISKLATILFKKREIFILTVIFFLSACGTSSNQIQPKSDENKSKEVSNQTFVNTAPTVDTGEKARIEEALKKEGFKDLTIDYSTQPPTIRGNVPQDKIAIAILVAEKAAGKKLMNGLTEK